MRLLRRIERYLYLSGTRPTTFGRGAANDPRLVFDMRDGREPRAQLRRRLLTYLKRRHRELEKCRRP